MKSVQLIFFWFLILVFSSCKVKEGKQSAKEPDKNVKLEILNNTIVYFPSQEEHNYGYKTKEEEDKSYNVVRYKLTNNSNKNYLFFIKDLELVKISGIRLFFKDDNGKRMHGSNILFSLGVVNDSCSSCKLDYELEELKSYNSKVRRIHDSMIDEYYQKYMSQTQIVYPGESWEFTALLSLPTAILEDDFCYFYHLKEDVNYKFYIEYDLNEEMLQHLLPKAYLKQLENNNVEIFKGKLISNEVEVFPNR